MINQEKILNFEEEKILRAVEKNEPLANFPKRAFAIIIDFLTIKLIMSLFWPLTKPLFSNLATQFISEDRVSSAQQIFLMFSEASLFMWYFTVFTYLFESTPGKFFVNIKIIRDDNKKLTLMDVLVRHASYFLSYIVLFTGFLFPLFRNDKKCLHDIIAKTKVVNRL